MGQRLQRHLGSLGTIESKQYAVDESPLTARCIFVCCPKCAGIEDISVTHKVGAGGAVTPRFECQTVTCGYAEFLELDCWNGEPHR